MCMSFAHMSAYTLILVLHYRHYTVRVFMHGDYEYLSRLVGTIRSIG